MHSTVEGSFEHLDCGDLKHLVEIVRRNGVDCIYHLAALLSATAEGRPRLAWQVNMGGLSTTSWKQPASAGVRVCFSKLDWCIWPLNPKG